MRIKLDENLPATLRTDLEALGHEVDTVPDEGFGGREDPDVWQVKTSNPQASIAEIAACCSSRPSVR